MLIESIVALSDYCEREDFKGWDPYDALNSPIIKFLRLDRFASTRLLFIQLFKRLPFNLRPLFLVPKVHNSKAIALFLSGYCNLYRHRPSEVYLKEINYLANKLISLKCNGYSGAAWGYPFSWQARNILYFPAGTPNIIATSYSANALLDAYEATQNKEYLEVALSSAEYILKDLNKTTVDGGYLLSYSTLKGNDTVINASLHAAKVLSRCYYYTKYEQFKTEASKIANACCNLQSPQDGSWPYGLHPVQSWIDSFHTGYNLECLAAYQLYTQDTSFAPNIVKGYAFYKSQFFLPDGRAKYYHNKLYPIDIHSIMQLFVTEFNITKLGIRLINSDLTEGAAHSALIKLQSKEGYFYYQIGKYFTIKTPYMRWSNAFAFNALTIQLLNEEH